MTRSNGKDILEFAKRHDILDKPAVRKLVLAAGLSNNNHLQNSAKRAVLRKSIQQFQYPFKSQLHMGNIDVGRAYDNRPFYLSEEELVKHLLAVGQSGSGKTTLFYSLMDQLEVPYWSFDLKQDYRHLTQEQDLLVLPWTEFKFNPLKPPPGVSPRRWAQVLTEIFSHATSLLSGSKNYLLKQVIELYKLYNLFEDVAPPYPSLHELELLMETDRINYVRKTSNYRDTVLNRLEAMNLVAGSVFDCSQGYPVETLLERNVVFEFDGLNRDVQNFLMEILFAYVYEYRLSNGERDQGLQHLFFLDEGKQVFSVYKERQDAAGLPAVDELTAKMREFGEGLMVADQEASKLTDSIKANTYTKVLLPTGDRKQFDAVADSIGLSERQAEYAQQLGTGEAVVQVGNRNPIPVQLDEYKLEKTISDDELQSLMAKQWNNLSSVPRERTPEYEKRVAPNRSEEPEEPEIVEDPQPNIEVSNDTDRLLEDVVENPFKTMSDRYTEFSSSYKGNKSKNELVEHGLAVERHVKMPTGEKKLLELTEKGRDYVENRLGIDPRDSGRGGIVHRYWQNRTKGMFEDAGWYAELEVFDADIYVNMNDTELVAEVAMEDRPRELEHVKQHLEKGFDTVWIIARNPSVRDGLKQRLKENQLLDDRIAFRLFREVNKDQQLPW